MNKQYLIKTTANRQRNNQKELELLTTSFSQNCITTLTQLKSFFNAHKDFNFDIEIGFGDGDTLLHRAKTSTSTSTLYIGIELYTHGVIKLLKQVSSENIHNLWVIAMDARVIAEILPVNSCNYIRIPFPDPWPKKRHNKRRLIQKDLIINLIKGLKKKGCLVITTDNTDYAEQSHELIKTFQELTESHRISKQFDNGNDSEIESKFERKAKQKNHKIVELSYFKK